MAIEVHELSIVLVDNEMHPGVAVCSCGSWEQPVASSDEAEERFELHCDAVFAERCEETGGWWA
jgi:hypothetical protein